jgi:hypothetical protein
MLLKKFWLNYGIAMVIYLILCWSRHDHDQKLLFRSAKRTGNLKIVHTNYVDREAGLDKKMEDLDSLNWVEKIMEQRPYNNDWLFKCGI